MTFADTSFDPYIITGVVGILATCVGGLLWIIKFMFQRLVPLIEEGNKATQANTRATKSADTYLRGRNGRDAEFHDELIKEIQTMPDKITQEIKEQHVSAQVVEKAIVKKADIKDGTVSPT